MGLTRRSTGPSLDKRPYIEKRRSAFLNELSLHLQTPIGLPGWVARDNTLKQTLICGRRLAEPVAPPVIPGVLNRDTFAWCVREPYCPTLESGQVVVMHNLLSQPCAVIRTLRSLSPYSPAISPILMVFSKLKALVRVNGRSTVDTLLGAIGRTL